jgi:high-affinity iron transporter
VLGNFVIGLREGLEAALVVGILVAYLVRTGHRRQLLPVWIGVAVAVLLSLAVGALLTFTSSALTGKQQEAFAGVMSIIAVIFVTWMIFWMRRTARSLKGELHGRLDTALGVGSLALAGTAFLAVGREGLETAVFLWSAIQAAGSSAAPITGGALGLATAVVLGYLIYRRSIALNLATFFKVTGGALVIVAAGVLGYGVHDLQEGGLLPGLGSLAFDVRDAVPLSSWYGALLHGIFGFTPNSTWLQMIAHVGYLVPVLYLFFRPAQRAPAASTPAPMSSAVGTPAR